ncbi:MAG: GNAT family N-acetyltransferase [Anaerolineales bacterium]|nr:GNAT family N-acetyltransferase [Anaerolineales bacterium]
MPEVRVRTLERMQTSAWSEALASSATFTALDAWSDLVEETYGYSIHRFEAVQGDNVQGLLVLTHVRHPILGKYLSTSPFGSYGGFAYTSIEARDALMNEARKLSDELGVEYCVLRFQSDEEAPAPWLQHPIYSTYLINLPSNPEDLWKRFVSKDRWKMKQALTKGFQIQFGQLDLLDDTYKVMSQSMHELGSPYHSKAYLRRMAEKLGDQLEFAIVRDEKGVLVGAAVVIYDRGVASNLHANILRDFRTSYAGEFLYWSLLERYCKKGIQVCDMGRSLNGSGNEVYKMKWKPDKVPLAYWYYMPKGGQIPELNQKSAEFQFAIRLWKFLPSFLVRALGPALIRGIV